eukprot:CAMPEP_0170494620 /NCGR_PEP_ID=MMETSP0208-20121228/14747_1 /TAXON_ID=197538 /ORGANISM="Strombidium inclinatum, Strain S3" /LENGTH=161 /DNA_ID=CAMNT_0010770703 /DNA_START=638 /DNA_END=1124 /DNA_ORIENTATION=+
MQTEVVEDVSQGIGTEQVNKRVTEVHFHGIFPLAEHGRGEAVLEQVIKSLKSCVWMGHQHVDGVEGEGSTQHNESSNRKKPAASTITGPITVMKNRTKRTIEIGLDSATIGVTAETPKTKKAASAYKPMRRMVIPLPVVWMTALTASTPQYMIISLLAPKS